MRSRNSIATHEVAQPVPIFLETLTTAVSQLKNRLQQDYEKVYPDLGEIIRFVIKAEEVEAWKLAPLFPHLVLPALVEEHVEQLGLHVVAGPAENVLAPSVFAEIRAHSPQAIGQA